MNQVTMSDVAKAAGVSLTTVGRVLHGGYISQEKREKIERAIRELGYIPNKAASGLKSSKSHMIGHLMQFNPNQLYANIASGIERSAMARGYSVLALTMYSPKEEEVMLQELLGRGVDGIVITSNTRIRRETVERLVRQEIPVAMVERTLGLPGIDSIMVNDRGGAFSAVEALCRKGRRRIGFVGPGDFGSQVEESRFDGYGQALRAGGLALKEEWVVRTKGYSCKDGYEAARRLFGAGEMEGSGHGSLAAVHDGPDNLKGMQDDMPGIPDAVFCASDILAAGVLQYLYARGLRVPEDVSVTGYDDTLASYLSPKLSSVALDVEAMGEQVLEMLLSREPDPGREARTVYIDTVYVDRDS